MRKRLVTKRLPTSDEAKRLALVMHRKLSTSWLPKEIKAFRSLGPLQAQDLLSLERYYRKNWPPCRSKNFLRHDLFTLLNNYSPELDRANAWNESNPDKPRKIIPLPMMQSAPFIPSTDPGDVAARERFEAELEIRRQRRRNTPFQKVKKAMGK